MSDTPTNLIDQLKRDEGLRLKVYDDVRGIPTIGYGRNLRDRGISEDEAIALLVRDISDTKVALYQALPWVAIQIAVEREAVLLNMACNLGVSGLLEFKQFLALVQSGQYDAAADDMLTTPWAQQVGPRAQRLAEQMRTGQWV